MNNFNFGLYPVITEEFCKGRDVIDILNQVINAGVKIVQLREKNKTKKEIYETAKIYRKITKKNNVILIINDHIDIALAVNADGVHLGQDDLPCQVARKLAPNLIIGVSTHNEEEIKEAENNKATYLNIGPIFSTATKKISIKPLGVEYLKSKKTNLPFSVMGGINKNNIRELLEAGARNIAMITEITMADDIYKTTKNLIKIIKQHIR